MRFMTRIHLILTGVLSFVLVAVSYSQTQVPSKPAAPIKYDEIGEVDTCEFVRRVSQYFEALSVKPDHQGYIINYGTDGEIANRERFITKGIAFRNFDRSRITFVRGGYLPAATTEVWLIPPNAENPKPSMSATDLPAESGSSSLFKTRGLGELEPFVLDSVKKEQQGDAGAERGHDDESGGRSKDNERHSWADIYIPHDLPAQEGSKIVILFYVDEKRYDIERVTRFVEEGRDFLAKLTKLSKQQLVVEFGGYRESPEAEFWFVPRNGKDPDPSPDGLCK